MSHKRVINSFRLKPFLFVNCFKTTKIFCTSIQNDKFLTNFWRIFFFILSYTQVDKYASKWCTVMTFWTLALAHVIKFRRKFLIRIVSKENQNEILLSFGQQMLAENQQFTTRNDNLQEGFIKMNVLSNKVLWNVALILS